MVQIFVVTFSRIFFNNNIYLTGSILKNITRNISWVSKQIDFSSFKKMYISWKFLRCPCRSLLKWTCCVSHTYLQTAWIFSPNKAPIFPVGTLRKLTSHGMYFKPILNVQPLIKRFFSTICWLSHFLLNFWVCFPNNVADVVLSRYTNTLRFSHPSKSITKFSFHCGLLELHIIFVLAFWKKWP